jgi:hypothetical protein
MLETIIMKQIKKENTKTSYAIYSIQTEDDVMLVVWILLSTETSYSMVHTC